jgi:RNA polymerase sigma factor (sigma-70 family)
VTKRTPTSATEQIASQAGSPADSSVLEVARLDQVDTHDLVSALSLICGDPHLAEEAVQEAFLRAWQKAKRAEHVDSWKAWLFTVALNETRTHFRRLGRERSALQKMAGQLEHSNSTGDQSDRVTNSVDLVRAMTKLTRRQREVVTMHYRLDMAISDIGATLGVSEGTVKTLLHRARSTLLPLVEEQVASGVSSGETANRRSD